MGNERVTPRTSILEEAANLIDGDRNASYGEPTQDFSRTAAMWEAYLGVPIKPHDVAVLMSLLKLSRIRWSPEKRDHWVDLAGYAGCGYECTQGGNEELREAVEDPDGYLERRETLG